MHSVILRKADMVDIVINRCHEMAGDQEWIVKPSQVLLSVFVFCISPGLASWRIPLMLNCNPFFAASRVGFSSRYVWYHLWYQDQDTLLLRVVRVWQYTTPQLDSALFSILRSASYPQSKLTRFQNFSISPTPRKRLFHPCWKLTTISNLTLLSWPLPHHGKLPNPGNSDSWHLWRKGHRCVATGGNLGRLSFL